MAWVLGKVSFVKLPWILVLSAPTQSQTFSFVREDSTTCSLDVCVAKHFLSGEPRRADLDMQFLLPKSPVRRNQRTLVKPWSLCPWASVLLHPAWHQISSVEKWVEWQAPCVTLSPALLRHELKDGEAPLWVSLIVKYGENKWRLKKRILSMTNNFSPKGSCH